MFLTCSLASAVESKVAALSDGLPFSGAATVAATRPLHPLTPASLALPPLNPPPASSPRSSKVGRLQAA